MELVAEERGVCHGLELATRIDLATGGAIGTCACGAMVYVPELQPESGDLECEGCGARWHLEVVLKVRRA